MDIVGTPLQSSLKRNNNKKNKSMTSNYIQNKRYEIAKDIMVSSLSNNDNLDYILSTAPYKENEKRTVPKTLARFATACADALIEELSKEEE